MLALTIVGSLLAARVIELIAIAVVRTIQERRELQRENQYLEKLSKRQTVDDE